ncbi:hypothetical protein GCM10025881_07840 [Pseudolysinimonas kribbensis]|uniref:Peptidase M24 domain-containing protein n=1 Tax=Pseudolysinimonas kribbensis TaxID=433641 RepID=A0ABQ6K048_9MICO|nr:hypothetical protein GCM10025881_07840 [Pseudolysinimonas kribbensis]
MIELRTPAEIERMRVAGEFVGRVLEATRDAADVGVNLLELDALAHDMIRREGAESCYIDYHPSFGASPFGKVICLSVNDAVLHGLPHDYVLRDGDILSSTSPRRSTAGSPTRPCRSSSEPRGSRTWTSSRPRRRR